MDLSERKRKILKAIIENYIEIDGEDVLMDTLSEEKRAEIAILLQDTAMSYAGYKRVQIPG